MFYINLITDIYSSKIEYLQREIRHKISQSYILSFDYINYHITTLSLAFQLWMDTMLIAESIFIAFHCHNVFIFLNV
jgi:hypothetical protein